MPSHYESFGMVRWKRWRAARRSSPRRWRLAFLVQDGVTGYTSRLRDDDALCERLTALLGDESLRQRMGRNAAKYAQKYDWEKIAKAIVRVIRS